MSAPITHIIVHCSDSAWGTAREIKKWHTDPNRPGGPFSDIGYHFVILNGQVLPGTFFSTLNGSIECGRELDGDRILEDNEKGAHALGYNGTAIGICLVLKDKPTIEQLDALKYLVLELCTKMGIPAKNVLGHCETDSGKAQGKTCPNFDVEAIRQYLKGRLKTSL